MTLFFEIMAVGPNNSGSIYSMLDTVFCAYLPESELLLRDHNLMTVLNPGISIYYLYLCTCAAECHLYMCLQLVVTLFL